MTFLDHLKELRLRIITSLIAVLIGSVVAFLFFDSIIAALYEPFLPIDTTQLQSTLFVNTLFEGFLTKIKVSVISGVVLSFPVHLYNVIRFVFPGLNQKERKIIALSLGTSFILIVVSVYYSYFEIIPLSVRFLTSKQFIPANVGILLNYDKNIFYILQFILITLIVFQIPIILELLLIMNVVNRRQLLRVSRYVIIAIFVLSATITPPDFISQITISTPLIMMFFLTILIARVFHFGEE